MHLTGLCSHGNSPVLASGTEASWSTKVWPSQFGRPHSHSSMLCGGRLAQGVQHPVGGSLQAVLWRAPCPGQQGPEQGLGIKGHEPSWGVLAEMGVYGSPQIKARLMCRSHFWKIWGGLLPFGKFILMVPGLEEASHLAIDQTPWHLSTTGAGQWTPSSQHRRLGEL